MLSGSGDAFTSGSCLKSRTTSVGQDWLCSLFQDWNTILCLYDHSLSNLLQRYSGVFGEGLRGFYIKLVHFPTPFAHRPKPKSRNAHTKHYWAILFLSWAALIIPVMIPDRKSVRICGDFKLKVNCVLKLEWYPTPKIDNFLIICRMELASKSMFIWMISS